MFQTLFRLSDTAVSVLLSFLALFFRTVNRTFNSLPESFLSNLPSNIRAARRLATNHDCKNELTQYVCCPNCHSLYHRDECIIQLPSGQIESKKCTFQKFPFHPVTHFREPCGTLLMKNVKSPSGKRILYPRLIYYYKSLTESLKELMKRPGFSEMCEQWRHLVSLNRIYNDVYDGEIWKDFQTWESIPFLSAPFNFGLHLNVDWFQPFERTQHSEGVLYLSIMNLPRNVRFLQHNIILVGVIPGPREPQLHMNTFLQPLVDELKELWTGVPMSTHLNVNTMVRAALLCVGCDLPAARKVCGFLGHRAKMGCSKCLLSFPTARFGEKPDYSNFDRSVWKKRNSESHRQLADKHRNCKTQSERNIIEREHGIRYTCLLQLPYFDASRMCIIDPMHNLLLGTAKRAVELWKDAGILQSKELAEVQAKVDCFICPNNDMGRMPSKIASSFAGFTADQWRNWTVFFSLFSLKGILPPPHYQCWLLFVKACFLLCRRRIDADQLSDADTFLNTFCLKFASIYGKDNCTINMHLHGHLQECVKDYGPVYSFWCFAFERMNGILGSYHTNNRNISIQLARRFLENKLYASYNWPQEFVSEFLPLLQKFEYNKGSLKQGSLSTCRSDMTVTPLPPIQEHGFLSWQLDELLKLMKTQLNLNDCQVLVLHNRTKAVLIDDAMLGAEGSRHSNSCFVLALHARSGEYRLAKILFFAECIAISDNGARVEMWVAAVSWFDVHQCKVWFGFPTQVWSTSSFQELCFLPLQNIKCPVVYTKATVNFGRVIGDDVVFIVTPIE